MLHVVVLLIGGALALASTAPAEGSASVPPPAAASAVTQAWAPPELPDLVVRRVSGPIGPASPQGMNFYLKRTTVNRGDAASPATRMRFLLSRDRVVSHSDRHIGGARVPALGPGERFRTALPAEVVPRGTPLGAWYVIACVDPHHDVAQSRDDNDCRASVEPVKVRLSDLKVRRLRLSEREASPGDFLHPYFFAINVGGAPNPPSRLRFVLSRDQERSSEDRYFKTQHIGIMAAHGGETESSAGRRLPDDTPLGTWWLIACADPRDEAREIHEHNQCRTVGHALEVTAAAS